MKVFTFVSLLALAQGSNIARAADSGTHTVNLTVDTLYSDVKYQNMRLSTDKTSIFCTGEYVL